MTTLILGAGGMLGRALRRQFPDARPATRQELDLTDEAALAAAIVPGVDLVLNAAADTRVDLAESDPAHLDANDRAVGTLAELCARARARLVHVSTDYVFDGRGTRPYREGDPIDPVNAYGRGKRGGEERALESRAEVLIVRTSWVFGPGGANFPDAMLKQAESGKTELKVVSDQVGRPTFTNDLARAIRLLTEVSAAGVVHFANQGETTWYSFAIEALRLAGHEEILVRPCASGDFPRPARRPGYSVLDTSLYEKTVGERPRPWRDALAEYVADRVPATSPTRA
ncbi:MAG: dTDP-4-dehydrorhamnose reductase [Thermoanaerobaculia bacterium]